MGRDLQLEIQVVRMPDCSPVAGAIVEVWHCDAEGNYSGYLEEMGHDLWQTLMLAGTGGENVPPNNEARYLRGAQISDADGKVKFDTILPGWYEPRIPHIHFKIISEANELLTSQFYFDPDYIDGIFTLVAPYTKYGPSLYRPKNDLVVGQMPEVTGLQLMPRGGSDEPLQASAKIGIAAAVNCPDECLQALRRLFRRSGFVSKWAVRRSMAAKVSELTWCSMPSTSFEITCSSSPSWRRKLVNNSWR